MNSGSFAPANTSCQNQNLQNFVIREIEKYCIFANKKSMENNDLKLLISVEDRIIAEDVQSILEESGIYTMLVSDNPASSVLSTYLGSNPTEGIDMLINKDDYERAIEILNDSPYKELVDNADKT